MNCRTPGCGATIPPEDHERRFCERCGWPLARGSISHEPRTVQLIGNTSATLTLRVDNLGVGPLRWALEPCPPGVQADTLAHGEVPAGGSVPVPLTLDPTQLPPGDELLLPLRVWDKSGAHGDDLRQGDPEDCWREIIERIPVARPQYGPLEMPWRTLLFGGSVTQVAVAAHNAGEIPMEVTAQATGGYTLDTIGHPQGEKVQLTIPAGFRATITVARPPGGADEGGTLTLTVPGLPSYVVDLVPVEVHPPSPPPERWIIALDFGTTKSAVMVLDQHKKGAEPEPILWSRPGGEPDEKWLPSVVAWEKDRPTGYGWQVGLTETGDNIVRGLKMRLREDDERVQKSIVFFLRGIFDQIANQYGPEIFHDSRLVFTLPVLDNADEYEEQRRRTLARALEAGKPYGLREEQCDFYKEPECAAVDFLHELQMEVSQGKARHLLAPESWLCVLDMGGGTTDITFARFGLTAEGKPTFDQLRSLGFPNFAGDRIDEEFYRWCLEHWYKNKRLLKAKTGPLAAEELEGLTQAPQIQLEGEQGGPYDPLKRSTALRTICDAKERMYGTSPPQNWTWDVFTRTENHVTLQPDLLHPVLCRLAEKIFVQGVSAPGSDKIEYPPVASEMRDTWGLLSHQIKLLCLTGGTCHIPEFEQVLREAALTSPRTERRITPEHIRLNVVRGAARRPGLRIQGRLLCDVQLGIRGTHRTLAKGAVAGASQKLSQHFGPGEKARVEIRAVLPGRETRTLFACEVTNDDPEPGGLFLEAQAEYVSQQLLRLRLIWLTNPEREALPWTVIQQMPAG